jgi:multisubunit Na+/H+ antiporter MnhB subunit
VEPANSIPPKPPTAISIVEARVVLVAFLFTFIAARVLVFLIMAHRLPDMYLHMGHEETHVHHLNYGIFLLSFIGAYLIFVRPTGKNLSFASAVYGVGMGLTFDEFGMWYHLTAEYWQRASFDAVVVIAAALSLFALAPEIKRFRPKHWITAALMLAALVLFGLGLAHSFRDAARHYGPRLHELERSGPQE